MTPNFQDNTLMEQLQIRRAFQSIFRFRELFIVFLVHIIIGFLRVSGYALTFSSPFWMKTGLFFFVSSFAMPLLAFIAVPLVRGYVHRCKGRQESITQLFKSSFDLSLSAAAAFCIFPCCMMVLTLIGAVDVFFSSLPLIGSIWTAFFAFFALFVSLLRIALMLLGLFSVYYLIPELALSTHRPLQVFDRAIRKIGSISKGRIIGFFVGFVPILVLGLFTLVALFVSDAFGSMSPTPASPTPVWLMSWLSRAAGVAALLSLPTLFFFYMGAEGMRLDRLANKKNESST